LDLAEEMTAEAFASAVARWPIDGTPPNPGGWVTTTAYRKMIDRVRREAHRESKHREALALHDPTPFEPVGAVEDDRLRLLFICCHPALAMEARVALTLRMVGGLKVSEIARAFLVQESTMGQRISRAKAKLKASKIPFSLPTAGDLSGRIDGVLAVLYLIFNEGYFASGPDTAPLRRDLTGEAIRLARLARELLPDEQEAAGLLALMLLSEARADARLSADGDQLVRLDEQDRGSWDRALISEGLSLLGSDRWPTLTSAPRRRFTLLAENNAVHVTAARARDTDWERIVSLYEQLELIDPSPLVTLNKAIAIGEFDSPLVALSIVERLRDALDGFHGFHVTRAELLRASGQPEHARAAYGAAIDLARNTAERAHLIRRRDQLAVTAEQETRDITTNGDIK
jgi:RNA polymerase sigma-70 factor (ECF subfamily)